MTCNECGQRWSRLQEEDPCPACMELEVFERTREYDLETMEMLWRAGALKGESL